MSDHAPTICMMGATFTTGNMGVNALAAGIIKSALHHSPRAKLFWLEYGRNHFTEIVNVKDRSVPVEFVNMRFSKRFYSNHIIVLLLLSFLLKLIPFRGLRTKIVARNVCLRRLAEADIVASISGGDSFSDIYGMERFFYGTLSQLLAISMGKRLVLLPQTIGPFRSFVARRVARFLLRHADLVYARDFASRKAAQSLATQHDSDKYRFCYDLGFILDPIAPACTEILGLPLKKSERPRVGLNVSGLLYVGGYTRKNMFGLKARYDELVERLIGVLVNLGAEVLLVPHVFGTHLESDSVACRKIYEHLQHRYPGAVGCLVGKYSHNEIKHLIGTCDFFIGSRMHACIAALSQCVPSLAIAYSDKFAGVLETIGVPSLAIDARRTSADEIVATVTRIFAARRETGRELRERIPDVIRTATRLFDDIIGTKADSAVNCASQQIQAL